MERPYRRLPGRRWLVLGVSHRLWLGADHLLAVVNNRYTESYQRFDFRDIQALICRRTPRRLVLGALLGAPAALILLVGATDGVEGLLASLFFAGPLLAGVLANALRGPTCVTHLRTAVSSVELPSLARVRSFERAVGTLRPRLEAAQGALGGEELQAPLPAGPREGTASAAPRPRPAPAAARPYRGPAHDVLFGLMVATGLLGLARALAGSVALTAAGGGLVLAVVAALTFALVRQQGTDLPASVRRVVWGVIGCVIAAFGAFYVLFMYSVFGTARAGQPDAVFRFVVGDGMSPAGFTSAAFSLAAIGLGVSGALRMRAHRAVRRPPGGGPPGPPAPP